MLSDFAAPLQDVSYVARGSPRIFGEGHGSDIFYIFCLSSALWKNGGSDPDVVWNRRSDGSRDEAGIGVWRSVHGKGYFWGEFRARQYNQCGLFGVRVRQCRDAALFPNYLLHYSTIVTWCTLICTTKSSGSVCSLAVVALSRFTFMFYYFYRFLLSSCVHQLLIIVMMMMMKMRLGSDVNNGTRDEPANSLV